MNPARKHDDVVGEEKAGEGWNGLVAALLVVGRHSHWRQRVERAAAALGIDCEFASTAALAERLLGTRARTAGRVHDLMLVDVDSNQRDEDRENLRMLACAARERGTRILAAQTTTSFDAQVDAMELGAAATLTKACTARELEGALQNALQGCPGSRGRARMLSSGSKRAAKLNLNPDRAACVSGTSGGQNAPGREEHADPMNQITTASEFNTLIRQELDVESLLRSTLEFVLGRSGPTNAAVFLPSSSGDYSLGAYVNYDCPKDSADILLDHLANSVAPRFEQQTQILHLTTPEDVKRHLADDADWMLGSHVVAFACHHEDECLAIFMIFRDAKTPFQQGLLQSLRTIADLFAQQLARVIHIHHRHLPKDKWGMPGAYGEDRDDLAA